MKIYYGAGFVDVFVGIGFDNHNRFNISRNQKKELIFHRVQGKGLERADYFNMKHAVVSKLTGKK